MGGSTLSIQTRLVAALSLSATVLVGLIGLYWVDRHEHELNTALVERQQHMAQLVARGFAEPVWNNCTVRNAARAASSGTSATTDSMDRTEH